MGVKQKHFIPGNAQIGKLLRPTSIAIIGATDTEGKTGTMITKNLISGGYGGHVVCVNPHRETVFGAPCYASLNVAPEERVDCAIVVVPAGAVEEVIRESAMKCKNFVVIAAGFGESGDEGRMREEALRSLADEYELAILGPNCLGFITPGIKANASFAPHILTGGNVALLSQSGALAVALLDQSAMTTQGFSFVISLGNKMQIDESILMEFLAQDNETDVIAMYIESVTNGEQFVRQARALTEKKPIVILRGGTTEAGQKASMSHTGALMQESAIFDAVCEKYGIIQTTSLAQFVDMVAFVRRYKSRAPKNPVVVTNAGGLGVLTTDAFARAGMVLERIGSHTQAQVAEKLPVAAATENPIDILGDAGAQRYRDVFDVLVEDCNKIDSVLSILTPQAQTPVMEIARIIADRNDDMMHVAVFVGGARTVDAMRYLMRAGIPTSATPEAAAMTMAAINHAQTSRYGDEQDINAQRVGAGERIHGRVRDENRPSLYYAEVSKMAELYNIPLSTAWRMDYDSPSSVTFPCVVKVDAPTILHKTDKGGVIVNIKDGEDLNSSIDALQKEFPGERIIVQPHADSGMEIIIGAKRDGVFGPVILIGYGGIYTEEIAMTELFIPPFDTDEARKRLERSRLGFLFRQTRGQAPYDSVAIAHIITALGQMMVENIWITEIDINPLFIYNNGKSPLAVDMKIITHKK